MKAETQSIVKELEDIKARIISVEMRFLESEEASKEDQEAVAEALKEYKKGKTTPFRSQS